MTTAASKYHLATANDAEELGKLVNELLGDGWLLYGEPVVASTIVNYEGKPDRKYTTFSQALIKF